MLAWCDHIQFCQPGVQPQVIFRQAFITAMNKLSLFMAFN